MQWWSISDDEIDCNHIETQLRYQESSSNSDYDSNYDFILMPVQ